VNLCESSRDSVNTTLPCTTLGSSSAMLIIVMDVKTMTQSVPHNSNFEKIVTHNSNFEKMVISNRLTDHKSNL